MKYILYTHQLLRPLIVQAYLWTYNKISSLITKSGYLPRWSPPAQRRIHLVAMLCALSAQIVLIWLVHGLVGLCLSVVELYVELANKHLEITL